LSFATVLCAGLLVVRGYRLPKARIASGIALAFAFGLGQLLKQIGGPRTEARPSG